MPGNLPANIRHSSFKANRKNQKALKTIFIGATALLAGSLIAAKSSPKEDVIAAPKSSACRKAYAKHPALLRMLELETLSELARNGNGRI